MTTTMNSKRILPIKIGDVIYQITSDDNYLDYVKDGFEPQMVNVFKSLIDKDKVVFDIGANIGCTAILFGSLCKVVHAFEPSKSTFAILTENVASSNLQNIYLNNIGLGESCYESELTFSPSNRSGGFVSDQTTASSGHTIEKIKIESLDSYVTPLDISAIDFLKIDVEGFEGHVLRGGRRTLEQFKPVVVLELNHWCLNAFQRTSIPDFFDYLRSIFPYLYAIDDENHLRANLHDKNLNYIVMYEHIIHFKWMNVLGAFHESQIERFLNDYPSR
jgi:FkbM family methyltransferase